MTEVVHNPEIVIEDGLIKVHENAAALVFSSEDSIRNIVGLIRREVTGHEPVLKTLKGRKEIASRSAKVSSSKVLLDKLGKALVEDWKSQAKVVDSARKVARDELDALRDEVRKPLTDWEEEQDRIALAEEEERKAKKAAEELAAEIERCHDEALLEDEVQTLRKEKALRDKLEAQRIHDEKIREDERKRVMEEADEKILKAQEDANRKVKEESDRIERENLAAENKRKLAEKQAAADAEAKRLAEEAIANNKRRQGQINRAAAEAIKKVFIDSGPVGDSMIAKNVIEAIVKGQIPNVSIKY